MANHDVRSHSERTKAIKTLQDQLNQLVSMSSGMESLARVKQHLNNRGGSWVTFWTDIAAREASMQSVLTQLVAELGNFNSQNGVLFQRSWTIGQGGITNFTITASAVITINQAGCVQSELNASDNIQISGSTNNDGIYEVLGSSADYITCAGTSLNDGVDTLSGATITLIRR